MDDNLDQTLDVHLKFIIEGLLAKAGAIKRYIKFPFRICLSRHTSNDAGTHPYGGLLKRAVGSTRSLLNMR